MSQILVQVTPKFLGIPLSGACGSSSTVGTIDATDACGPLVHISSSVEYKAPVGEF